MVLPIAIPVEASTEVWFSTLAATAPRKIAGARRRPRRTSSASASPVAGQMIETTGATTANLRPSLAVAKYTTAATSTSSANGGRPAVEVRLEIAALVSGSTTLLGLRILRTVQRCYGRG